MLKAGSSRPLIGVTGPDEGGGVAWFCTKIAVYLAGGQAQRITPKRSYDITKLDGLILGGGADIDPSRYKEPLLTTIKNESRKVKTLNMRFVVAVCVWLLRKILSIPSTRARKDADRDNLEFFLLKECTQRKIPVLGICRGGQLINVFFGGSLYQSISSFYTEKPQLRTVRPRKSIDIEPDTKLAQVLGRTHTKVNSLHDQSVKDLGVGLRVSARESNGVVQAIEHTSLPFLLGVQWHPEFLPLNPEQRRFFSQLVFAAKARHHLA